jgi:signal transduction histidine kinase/integral membrane sensor domain MASE1
MGVQDRAPGARSVGADVARVAVFFTAVLIGSLIGRLTYIDSSQVVLISPIAGLGFLWLASGSPRREWRWDLPVLLLAQLCSTLLSHGGGGQLVAGLLITCVQPVTIVLLLRRWAPDLWGGGGTRRLSTVRGFGVFLAASAVGSLLAALLRWWGLELLPSLDLVGFGMAAIRNFCWVLAIGLIGLETLPSLQEAARDPEARHRMLRACFPGSWGHAFEGLAIVAVTAGLYLAAFGLPVTFAISLVTVWAALRFSVVAAELHAFLSGTTALLLTLLDVGVFSDVHDRVGGAALAQSFLIVLMITGAVVGISAQARREATERAVRSEHTAAERAHLLDTVMDNMTEGLVVVQEDGQILVRNPAGRELIGLADTPPAPNVLSAASYGLHQVDGTPLPEDQMPAALAFAGHEVVEQDYLLRTPSFPEGRILEMSATHIPDPLTDGRRRVIINFRDVTLARQDRDNLASFAGVVAHDLLNPLSIVDGWAEALNESFLEGPVDPEDGAAMVTRILNASKHMRHFIDDLLNYAIARDHAIQRDDVDLSLLIEDVASLRRQHNSRPRIHVQPGLEVNGDASMLRQLFDNLLGNAVKYVAPGVRPHIIVGGAAEGDFVRITVDDNGIGVPPEQRRNVFENFQRVATDYSGTGIGLAICARIVGRHGGTIAVEDNPHGDGSRFTLTIPALVGQHDEVPVAAAPAKEDVG